MNVFAGDDEVMSLAVKVAIASVIVLLTLIGLVVVLFQPVYDMLTSFFMSEYMRPRMKDGSLIPTLSMNPEFQRDPIQVYEDRKRE